MKVRNGFVSNSSSSSFIIAVPMCCNTLGQLQDYLFKDETVYPNPYVYDANDTWGWPISDVAGIVFDDIKDQEPNTFEQMVEEYCAGYTPEQQRAERAALEALDIPDRFSVDNWQEMYKLEREYLEQYASAIVQEFMKKNPECFFYNVTYSDNCGELETAMEHGPLFSKIPHLKVSHH